jgi:branched-subunit amino acid ABC-type transport system permease component
LSEETATIVFGLSLGAVYALLVMGLILTYRVSRVLNLAHGAVAMFTTHVFWQFAVEWGWNKWAAAGVTVLVVAPAVGVVLGGGIFRFLSDRSEAEKLAASAVLVVVLNELVLKLWGGVGKNVPRLLPGGFVGIGDARVGADQIGAVILAAVIGIGLAVLLKATPVGIRMRAVAENADQARLVGVAVRRTQMVGWVVSSVLATVAGLIIAPFGTLDPFSLTFLVVAGLAAAVVGRVTNFGSALAGAVALGIGAAEMSRLPAGLTQQFGALSSAVPFFVLATALGVHLFRGGWLRTPRLAGGGTAVLSGGRLGGTNLGAAIGWRHTRPRQALWASGVIAFLVAGASAGQSLLFRLSMVAVWTIVFTGIVLLNGLGGQVSLCQMALMGAGALAGARVQTACTIDSVSQRWACETLSGGRAWLAFVLAVVVSGAVGAAVAALATRLTGVILGIATLSFGFFMDNTVFVSDLSLSGTGIPVDRPPGLESDLAFFFFCVAAAVLALLALRNVARSETGRVLRVIGTAELAAESVGVRAWSYKLGVFATSAALSGFGGYLLAIALGGFVAIEYSAFNSILLFVVVFAVGSGSLVAPVVAAGAYVFAPDVIGDAFGDALSPNLVFGILALAMLASPGGIIGIARRIGVVLSGGAAGPGYATPASRSESGTSARSDGGVPPAAGTGRRVAVNQSAAGGSRADSPVL